ncbi:MAG: addiction module protein [Desulfamplus sp.]|nr:addiction module protein [Desulfamplus sp.]
MNAVEIRKMSTVDRLQMMEVIWDSLLYDEAGITSPEWHGNILEERKKKIEAGKADFISIRELRERRRA